MNLSILIPVHRNELTVARTLRSIENSSVELDIQPKLQVIIVIDGVVDGSIDIVRRWQQSTKIHHAVIIQGNSGIAAARNVAWRRSNSTWVTFLDADDEMTSQRLVFARDRLRPNTVFIGQQDLINTSGLRLPNSGRVSRSNPEVPKFYIPSMLIERSALSTIGGLDESLRLSDDWDLAVRLRENSIPIELVAEHFVRRHIHGNNASFDEPTVSHEYLRTIREHLRRSRI